jgi:pimeloyl-ACP methyl ester carboxylesterase
MALYDRWLGRWPEPSERLTVATRHGDTFVIASGAASAPPLVLFHGGSSNSSLWLGDMAEYGRDHRVYAVDLLGEAGKSAPSRPPMAGPAYVEWLEDVLEDLKIDGFALEGVSQGAWAALKFATTRPERVRKLVLLCPGGVTPPRVSWLLKAIPLSPLGPWGAGRIKRMFFNNQPIPPEVDEFMTLIQTHFKPRYDSQPIFSDVELRRLTMPVLLLAGAKDAVFDSEKTTARLRQCIPHLLATIFPEAGHVMYHTTDQVVPFLAATND